MSLSPRSTHIDILDYDTLLHVFMMNSDMFSDKDALLTTCATSLVCRRWRNLMLDTPSLWAKLIDMDWISYAEHYEFRAELMRRSGTAPLWIRMDWIREKLPVDHPKDIQTFLFDIVHENWHRIQKLVITFQIHSKFRLSSWPTLFHPAPALETFDVNLERPDWILQPYRTPEDTPISTLFSGCAPLLRTFELTSFKIDHSSPWLCHLQSLKFHGTYDIHLILEILSSTRQLQQLRISGLTHEDLSTSFSKAPLPFLKHLVYSGPFKEGAILLDHIELPLDCCLSMYDPWNRLSQRGTTPPTDENLLAIFTTYIKLAWRHLQSHKPTLVSLKFEPPHCIYVEVKAKGSTDVPLNLPIPMCKDQGSSVPVLILKELEELALPELSHTTELQLLSKGPLDHSFWSIFSCFTSVRTLSTDCKTLGYLAEIENKINAGVEQSILFPLLDVINLDGRVYSKYDTFKIDTKAAAFILSRTRNGRPITALYLRRENSWFCSIPDLESLAEARGLKVLYKHLFPRDGTDIDLEYVCGRVDRENTSNVV